MDLFQPTVFLSYARPCCSRVRQMLEELHSSNLVLSSSDPFSISQATASTLSSLQCTLQSNGHVSTQSSKQWMLATTGWAVRDSALLLTSAQVIVGGSLWKLLFSFVACLSRFFLMFFISTFSLSLCLSFYFFPLPFVRSSSFSFTICVCFPSFRKSCAS